MSKEFEKAKAEHKVKAPFKTFEEAVKSPTYKKMHDARKAIAKKMKTYKGRPESEFKKEAGLGQYKNRYK